ncbi:MAG: tRNA (adenosine(37)-N6)-threonylcarbamoyltransferase complex dimerization subunit type 1 TsaB [Akkermansia sp.]|nr:tRNA (adenosine(37)-N6)-threonylcarbamoyltransferase complex dimerization subunit type 1 TsaB [Akkermansia sp.]
MNILAIETSTPTASLCLSQNGVVTYSTEWTTPRNHDAYLFPALQEAMNQLGDERPDLVLIGAGPGSYGGVRVALAAAVGISTVKGCDTVAICSWLGLAEPGIGIISDAKRGGWTLLRPCGDICVLTLEQLKEEITNGLKVATIEDAALMAKYDIPVICSALKPTACGLIQAWNTQTQEQKDKWRATPPEPIYVRPPHITAAKRKPWEI